MSGQISWNGELVEFRDGDSVASALMRHGVVALGVSCTGRTYGLFCGIGVCQGCLVKVEGRGIVEACMTAPASGMEITSLANAEPVDV